MNPDESYVHGGFDSGGFHGTNANLKWVKNWHRGADIIAAELHTIWSLNAHM